MAFPTHLDKLLTLLFEAGSLEISNDRPLAAAVFRAAKARSRWDIAGSSSLDEATGDVLYLLEAEPPLCDGGCGDRTGSSTGMCYQCQCQAHSAGWFDMDEGYARVGGAR